MARPVRIELETNAARDANGAKIDAGTLVADRSKRSRARRCPECEKFFSGDVRFCPFDGDALIDAPDWNPNADPLVGQVVDGRYEVLSLLGEGGTGSVYEVRHTTLGRKFALKVLRADIAQDTTAVTRFMQEAKAAAAIGHPNIVAVSDFGEVQVDRSAPLSSKVPYFVMELLSGNTLANLLRADLILSPDRTAAIALQCALALSAAHEAGVIHRDLKPDNIYLVRSGDREFAKLLDFGLAKIAGASRLTRQGIVFGTPHYMSPEQALGQPVDHRTDIYALGVILYECLTGRVPFEADSFKGVMDMHISGVPVPLEQRVQDPSRLGPLGEIVMRCLEKNPADRFATMAEVASALEEALPMIPGPDGDAAMPQRLEGQGAGGPGRPSKVAPASTEPKPAVLFGLAAAIAVVVGVVVWLAVPPAPTPVAPAPTPTVAAVPTPTQTVAPPPTVPAPTAPPPTTTAPPPTAPPVDTAVPPTPEATTPQPPSTAPPPTGTTAAPRLTGKLPTAKPPPAPAPAPAPTTKKKSGGGGDVVDPWG